MSSKEVGHKKNTPTDTQESPEQPHADLSDFQQQALIEIARLQASPETCYGLAIKERLEAYYDKRVNHGRLYPNLDKLVDRGLVEKGDIDRRTHSYALTDDGATVLIDQRNRRERALEALDDAGIRFAGDD